MTPKNRSLLKFILLPVRVIIAVVWLLDEAVRPLYRPALEWVSSLGVMERFSAWVKRLPRLAILVLFAIPFAIAEPLKVLALVIIAKGSAVVGILLLVLSYLMTFLIVERIYHAGRDKLLTYPWFKWSMDQIGFIRVSVLAVKTSTMAWIRTRFGVAG